MQVPSAFGT